MPASRPASSRPSLEYDRRRARRLLRALQRGDAAAWRRLVAVHPRYQAGAFAPAAFDAGHAATAVRLADALLVVAREAGAASWPAWKRHVEVAGAAFAERCAAFLRMACDNRAHAALALLRTDAAIARADIWCAAAAGDAPAVRAFLDGAPSLARQRGGALDREAILCATHSRIGRADPARAAGLVEVVGALLAHGADANAFFLQHGETNAEHRQGALYGACGIANDVAMTRLLLRHGADPNDGTTGDAVGESLYHAAEFADTACLRAVLAAGPRATAVTYCLGRALDFAHEDAALAFLEHGADPNLQIPWFAHRSHVQKAIANGHSLDVLRAMLARGVRLAQQDDHGLTPYRTAVRHGRDDVADLLRQAGADPATATPVDRLLGTCLAGTVVPAHITAPGKDFAPHDQAVLLHAVRRGDRTAVTRLLDAGLDVDGQWEGLAPIHAACIDGNLAMVELLLARGATPTARNAHGGDALGSVAWASQNHHERQGGITMRLPEEVPERDYPAIVRLLVARGVPLPAQPRGSRAVVDAMVAAGAEFED
jgi:ankyrin repeat protein